MRKFAALLALVVGIGVVFTGGQFLVGTKIEVEGGGGELVKPKTIIEKVLETFQSGTPAQAPLPNPPKEIRGIYLTAWSAGSPKVVQAVVARAKDSEINAVVMDIKDFTGVLSYKPEVPQVLEFGAWEERIKDVNGVIKTFHDAGIYVIARITVFQDPVLSVKRPDLAIHDVRKISTSTPISSSTIWLDNHEIGWIDPAARGAWEYATAIAKDAASRGFDEINFDYIRFPSDVGLEYTHFLSWDENTKRESAIKAFFEHLRKELASTTISADIFGQTTVTYTSDMGIGQVIEDAYANFDAVAPMIYPSHYIKSFLGFENAAKHPYEVVRYSIDHALRRLQAMGTSTKAVIRPWLQDFDLGGVPYTSEMVRAQIEATKDALGEHYAGYYLWDPANTYTWEALKPEEAPSTPALGE